MISRGTENGQQDMFGRIREENAPKPKIQSKADIEQVKKERLAMVKSLTEGNNEKTIELKKKKLSRSERGEGGEQGNGEEDGSEEDDDEDEEADMMQLMGFGGFNTTKVSSFGHLLVTIY